MRVIVVGAAGFAGREILARLAHDKAISDVISITDTGSAFDRAACTELGIECQRVNLGQDLTTHFCYSDAVVYAGWPISNAHLGLPRSGYLRRVTNLCDSVANAGVRAFVFGSSALGYREAPDGHLVDEDWPLAESSSIPAARLVAQAGELVNEFEAKHEITRVVALRPTLTVSPNKTPAGWRGRISKRVVKGLVAGRLIRIVPDLGPRDIQVVHVSDLADAFCLAVTGSVVGEFNLAAEPISSDMLAEAFHARARVPVASALKAHSYARRLGFGVMDSSTLRASTRTPLLDTGRASSELGWFPKHSGVSILAEWASSFHTTNEHGHEQGTPPEVNESVAAQKTVDDYSRLYQRALDLFGERVHALRDDQWADLTGYEGWNVWQLVSSVARQQYQTALRLRGVHEDVIEGQLPGDPLGFARADGWDLAAERGALAMREGPANQVMERVLPEIICDLVVKGRFLAESIGFEGTADPELLFFVEDENKVRGGVTPGAPAPNPASAITPE